MTAYFWVGGTGNFNTSSNSTNFALTSGGAAIPATTFASGDDITFDANSGSSFTVTINATAPTIRHLTVTGTSGMTLAGTTAFTVQGNIMLPSTGLTWSSTGTLTISGATPTPKSLNFNGVTASCSITINAASSTITLGSALTIPSTKTINFINATLLDFAGYSVTCGELSSTGSATRALTLGTGTITCQAAGASACTFTGATNLTLSAASATILMSSASAKTFGGNGYTFGTLKNAGAGALTIIGSNTFAELGNTVQPTTIKLTSGTTQTVTTCSLAGTSGNLVTLSSVTAASAATISKASGTVTANYLSIQDITATGGATFNATNSTNVSGNTGWNFITEYTLVVGTGAFTETGVAVGLLYGRVLAVDAASFALTGNNVTLTYQSGPLAYNLSVGAGAFAVTGKDVTLTYSGATTTRRLVLMFL